MELKEIETKNNGFSDSPRPLLKADSGEIPAVLESLEEIEAKFAAYVRKDVYGTLGKGEVPWVEKVLLGLALVTLVPIRFLLGMGLVLVYYVICRVCTLFSEPNREEEEEQGGYGHVVGWRREVIVRSGKFLSRMMLFVMGFYWIPETYHQNTCHEQEGSERSGVIISNHVSYLDILYHMSSSFPSFVAKRSVARLPLVGLISKCLGCVYVQRESKSSDCKGVSGIVTKRIQKAHEDKLFPRIMIFPEGTTTNGDFLLPFKTGAFLAKVPVLPVLLKYPYERFSPAWDSISGVRHVILLLCQFVNHLEVIYLPVYIPSSQEKEDPKLYASNVSKSMAVAGNLKLSEVGLPEKRIYHAALKGLFVKLANLDLESVNSP